MVSADCCLPLQQNGEHQCQGGHGTMAAAMMVEMCILWQLIFLLVFCMLFYVETMALLQKIG
jgi:hypothetical protein